MCGLTTLDIVTRSIDLNQPVGPGCLHSIERVDAYPGGIVSNTGLALAKLGLSTRAMSIIGDDLWGRSVCNFFQSGGLDTDAIVVEPGAHTATSIVLVDETGERSFLFAPGISPALDLSLAISATRGMSSGSWIVLGYFSLFSQFDSQLPIALSKMQSLGFKMALDCAGSGNSDTELESILPHLDCYFPSFGEAQNQTRQTDPRKIIETYRSLGASELVGVKLGKRGAMLSPTPKEYLSVDCLTPPQPIVDSTGAGDAFYAGLIAGLSRNLNIEQAARLATAAGAWCCTGFGGSAGVQNWDATCQLAGIK